MKFGVIHSYFTLFYSLPNISVITLFQLFPSMDIFYDRNWQFQNEQNKANERFV